MRTAIIVGLLYVAYAINPTYMTSLEQKWHDVLLVNVVFLLSLFGDLKELFYASRNKTR